MIKVSKEIAHRLHNEFRIPFGENGISMTHSNRKKYYVCENRRVKNALQQISK